MADHLVPLPGTGWQVWRSALLRSAGFPVAGVDLLAAPELAALADRHLAGDGGARELAQAFDRAFAALSRAVHDICADPLFREAMTWQNPGALSSVRGALRDGPGAPRNERRRRREEIVAKYWQRYCLKNDTVGFFGPMCWTTVGAGEAGAPVVTGRAGPGLVRERRVFFEWWALAALAERIGRDPRVRPWLPVSRQPHLTVRGRELLAPGRPPQPVPGSVAALLALADGSRTCAAVAEALAGAGELGFRRPGDVHAQLDELAARGVLRIGFDLPMDLDAEAALRAGIGGIPESGARELASGMLARLCAARDAVAAAAGPEALATAMARLEAEFVELTGREAAHRPGETYAGRTICHLDATRDLDIAFGPAVLERLAPLEPLLRSASWLTAAIGEAYAAALTDLHGDIAAGAGSAEVPLDELWFLAQGVIFGAAPPGGAVIADFLDRWGEVLRLAELPAGIREHHLTTADLAGRVAAAFPDRPPGWTSARFHSPDLHLSAPSWAALARGEFQVVLGELHIALPAFDTHFFAYGHPEPAALREAMLADLAGDRVQLLLPDDWPRNCARNAEWMHGPGDVQLGFAPAPGAHRDRLVPITELTVSPGRDGLEVRAADGRAWPVLEVFAQLIGFQTFDTWKLAGAAGHTPRIVVDGLVLVRETWRTTVGATGLAGVTGERDRYLAVRRWRRALGLPERVFVRVDTELKPCFVDLTSPVYARLLCTLIRGAAGRAGDDVGLVVTEMLPEAADAWLTDARGRRYSCELRLQIRDPRPAGRHPGAGVPVSARVAGRAPARAGPSGP